VLVAFTSDHHEVPLPPGHRFPMEKYRLLREALIAEGVLGAAQIVPSPLATVDELCCAHERAWVEAFLSGNLSPSAIRAIGFPWSPQHVTRTLSAVGGTLAAARRALAVGLAGNLAGGTHHAARDKGAGYCVFNDLAVAARVLHAEGRVERVAIVDLDVHQGDGTAAILGADPWAWTLSLHGEKNFPFRKVPGSRDVGLPDGLDDEGFLAALEPALEEAMAFGPDLILYQGGVDGLHCDRLGRLGIRHEGLMARDARVIGAARAAGVPLVATLGGGYAEPISETVKAHVNTWRVLTRAFENADLR
jgi:acetoin utilization deacetylase AcuC-like enzyme